MIEYLRDSPNSIGFIVAAFVLFGLLALLRPKARFQTSDILKRKEFFVNRLWLGALILNYIMALTFAYFFFKEDKLTLDVFFFYLGLVLCFVALSTYGLYVYSVSHVSFSEGEFVFRYGRKTKTFSYEEYFNAYYLNGYIWIELTEKYRSGHPKLKKIPAVFKDSGLLLEKINASARGLRSKSDS